MDIIFFCLLGSLIAGALIGSFLNVVIYRYNTGLSISQGRSQCFVCGKKLAWYELIPIVSFILQKGRCRGCQAKVSWQYPFVELITSVLFVAVVYRQISLYSVFSLIPDGLWYSIVLALYYFVVISILVVIAVYDIRHKIVPNGLVYTFMALAVGKLLLFTFLFALPLTTAGWFDLFAPIVLSTPFVFLWWISRGSWIGFGDAKLAFGIGALLGFPLGISAIMLAFWIGAGFGVLVILLGKLFPESVRHKLGMSSEIPFAPFLIIGTLLVWFLRIDILGLAQLLNV